MKRLLLISSLLLITSCGLFKPKTVIVAKPKQDRIERKIDCVIRVVGADASPINAGTICNQIFER